MKRTILILLCLLTTLMVASCQMHIDTDPWPASPEYGNTDATEVVSPAVPTEETAITSAPATTDAPIATDAPLPANEGFVPIVTQTPQPNNNAVEPGFNG